MNWYLNLAVVATLFLTSSNVKSKNIVLLPICATSHIRLHAHVGNELAKMNHTVWLGMPSDVRKRINISAGVNVLRYDEYFTFSVHELSYKLETTIKDSIETGNDPDWGWLYSLEDEIAKIYFNSLKDGKFLEFITNLKPDFIVIDWLPNLNDHVAIPYKLKIPFAVLGAHQYPITAKMPYSPVLEAFNSPYILNKASFFEQVKKVVHYMSPLINHFFSDRGYMEKLFPEIEDVPTTSELMSQAEVYLAESDPIFDYPRPSLPNLKLIGGLSAGPAIEVKDPFKSFLERSEKAGVGVAVLSFGSLFLNLPKKLELKLVSALKLIKLNTIWRANITSPDPDKILTSPWIPQNDLLGNKIVRVFITHSGAHSIYEGMYHGVPIVCMPLFDDQFRHAEIATNKGYCISLDLMKATADELAIVIEKVTSSQKIRASIGQASEIYRNLYKNPKQEAAFWIDHVLRYGGSYMRSSGQMIPMYLYLLDYVIAFLAGFVFASMVFVTCFIIRRFIIFGIHKNGKKNLL